MHPYTFFVLSLLLTATLTTRAQTFQDADSAFSAAANADKPLLLLFTGSDWCPNCLRLDRTILSTEVFEDFAHDRLILLTADFPQRKRQASELKSQNEALAHKYNPSGLFPTIVLFSPNGKKYTHVDYTNESPEELIEILTNKMSAFYADE